MIHAGQPLNISRIATNEGLWAGATVVQVYTECAHALRQPAAFRRARLEPGQSAYIDFALAQCELTAWDGEGNPTVFESDYRVYVGRDSAAPLAGSFIWQKN